MKSLLTNQDRKDLKRELVQEINKRTTLCYRFLYVLFGLFAAFNPGYAVMTIGIQVVKRFPPDTLEIFSDMAQAED